MDGHLINQSGWWLAGIWSFSIIVLFANLILLSRLYQSKKNKLKPEGDLANHSDQLLHSLMDSIPSQIYFKDRDGRFVHVNKTLADASGVSKEELIGRSDSDVGNVEWTQARIDEERHVMKTRKTIRVEHPHHSNPNEWTMSIKAPWIDQNGDVIGTLGISSDITDRKQAEQEAERERNFFREFMDFIPSGVYFKDKDCNFVMANKRHLRSHGAKSDQDLYGMSDFDFMPKDAAEKRRQDELEIMRTGKLFQVEEYIETEKGKIWTHTTKAPRYDEDGEIIGTFGLSRNITDQKRAEEQLRQSQKMEAVGQLAGGIAHDFNNLLQVILGYCSVLLDEYIQDPDERRNCIKEIKKSGQRAADLTSQLLAFSRKQPILYRTLDVNNEVLHLQTMLKRLVGEDIVFETQLMASCDIRGDSGQVSQVLVNLAVNASAAMPNGGLLTIETKNVEFSEKDAESIPEALPGSFVCISVTDNGVGMTEDVRERVFEPFFTTKGHGGTGMGLAAVYGIVQQHKGWVNLYSEPEKGTCFNIYFPALEKAEKNTEHEITDAAEKAQSQGERILLVEDEDDVRNLMVRALTNAGYEVVETADANDAEQIFAEAKGNFDLLFSDVVLRDQRGTDLADKLLKQKPQLLVLLSSGYTEERVSRDEVEVGEFKFLHKPVSINLLLLTIRKMFDEKEVKNR